MQTLEFDVKAALSVYANARPFVTFEDQATREFIAAIRPRWPPPPAHRLDNELLLEVYGRIKKKVDYYLASESQINLVMDESTNIRQHRILNCCINTKLGSFHLRSIDLQSKTMSAEQHLEEFKGIVKDLVGNSPERLNSVATDTCSTMRAFWQLLHQEPEYSHVFSVPCEAHGLQLLIKDLVSLPEIEKTFNKAQDIVSYFRFSPKRYGYLRILQKELTGKEHALVLAVITRWGTQYRLLKSVFSQRPVLQRYIVTTSEDPCEIKSIIEDAEFWNSCYSLSGLFEPIHKAQVESESVSARIHEVLPTWRRLKAHLDAFAAGNAEVQKYMTEGWPQRLEKQVLPLHYLAFYLQPQYVGIALGDKATGMVLRAFKTYAGGSYVELLKEFYCFRNKEFPYGSNGNSWLHAGDSELFWRLYSGSTGKLAKLALRVLQTPSNSVPSERAFSTEKLIHTKLRNRLTEVRVEMLTFIHVNYRVLTRIESDIRNPELLSDDALIALEDELIHMITANDAENIGNNLKAIDKRLQTPESSRNVSVAAELRRQTEKSAAALSRLQLIMETPVSRTDMPETALRGILPPPSAGTPRKRGRPRKQVEN
jgi:hypothetical protein